LERVILSISVGSRVDITCSHPTKWVYSQWW